MTDNQKTCLKVYGMVKDAEFHMIKCCSEDLHERNPDGMEKPLIYPMLEFEWNLFLISKKQLIDGEIWSFNKNALVYVNDLFIGGAKDFMLWAQLEQCYDNFRPIVLYNSIASKAYDNFLKSRNHQFVFLEFAQNDEILGRIIIELFDDLVPKTCKNFQSLCTEECGFSESDNYLSYKTSKIHRIVKNGWIQGGDIVSSKGNDGESIYGKTFEDENFVVEHSRPGVIGMANHGNHTNGSQFYITMQAAAWMNKKYVAFGQVIEGVSTLETLNNLKTLNDRPVIPISIVNCGMYEY